MKRISDQKGKHDTDHYGGYQTSANNNPKVCPITDKPSRTEIVGASVMRIEKIKRKTEVCRRHVPQLLLRGEHVASVVLL